MPDRPIVFSVAHSSKARGAHATVLSLDEYEVSRRASIAAFGSLAGDFACSLVDIGPLGASDYDDRKIANVNALQPRLGIEIHCNAGPPSACYGEVLHHRDSTTGKEAARVVARTMKEAFDASHQGWNMRGARGNTVALDKHLMFFLERTAAPCLIVEGLFITNEAQASWLQEGGAEAYGLLVAEGVRRWLSGARE